MSSYYYGSVNGASCSYAKLATYNSCGATTPAPAPVASAPVADVTDITEGFEDKYKPSYKVPAVEGIKLDALTHGGVNACGGYFSIMDAYGKDAGNCTISYTQN